MFSSFPSLGFLPKLPPSAAGQEEAVTGQFLQRGTDGASWQDLSPAPGTEQCQHSADCIPTFSQKSWSRGSHSAYTPCLAPVCCLSGAVFLRIVSSVSGLKLQVSSRIRQGFGEMQVRVCAMCRQSVTAASVPVLELSAIGVFIFGVVWHPHCWAASGTTPLAQEPQPTWH